MNRTKRFSGRLTLGLCALAMSGGIVAQEGPRNLIDMMPQVDIVQSYYDYEIAEQTYVDGQLANIWGWVPYAVNDGPDPSNPDIRIKRITDRSVADPHIGINALPDNHSSSVRLATQRYLNGYDDYGYPWTESAKGGRIGYVFTVTEQNAIAVLDYAAMLEYPQTHSIVADGNGWKYFQPWVQIYISVVDEYGNESPQEATRIIHSYTAPYGLSGWKQPTVADGWEQLNNVTLYDNSTGEFARDMVLLKKNWASAGFDLTNAIGYKVCIWCEYYDCAISSMIDQYADPEICWDHHMARLYSALSCTQARLQKEEETCGPATVTYSAPEGFSYRWYTATNPGYTISTDRVCTYQFTTPGEQTTLYCEMQSPSFMTPTVLGVDIANRCELTLLDAGCTPASYVTYSAPDGFSYSWHTTSLPNVIISTQQTCSYQFLTCGEQNELVCDLTTSLPSRNGGSLSMPVAENCPVEGQFFPPEFICADAATFDIPFTYTSGAPSSYEISFDANALANGFYNTGQDIPTGAESISIPMPPTAAGQYAKPNLYTYKLTVHQCDGNDLEYAKTIEIRYPSWLISQRWNDFLGLLNQNYNGGYVFSDIQWFQDDAPAYSAASYNSYLYQPGGLNPASEYYALLTRTLDGLQFRTCSMHPVIQQAPERSPERIQLTADNNNSRTVRVNTDLSGTYTIYTIDGKAVRQGFFGADYGSPVIEMPAAGAYVIRFRDNEQGEDTKKWIAE